MANWAEVTKAAPELAALAQARIEVTGLGFIGTLRKDGFPRISGVEPSFARGEMLIGSMTDSRKGADLARDPRMTLHNASVDKELKEPDVKITGLAVEVTESEFRQWLRDDVKARTGYDPSDDFLLYRIDVKSISSVQPRVDVLVIDSWSEAHGLKHVERK